MSKLMQAAVAIATLLCVFTPGGTVRAQSGPSDGVIRGWLDRATGTTFSPIGKPAAPGSVPVAGSAEVVERCSAILTLTHVDPPSSLVDPNKKHHYAILWGQVMGAAKVANGVALALSYNPDVPPVLDVPTDQMTLGEIGSLIRECQTPAALASTYAALADALEKTLVNAPNWGADMAIEQAGPCRMTFSKGSLSRSIFEGAAVSADGSNLWIRGEPSFYFHLDASRANRAGEIIKALQAQCTLIRRVVGM